MPDAERIKKPSPPASRTQTASSSSQLFDRPGASGDRKFLASSNRVVGAELRSDGRPPLGSCGGVLWNNGLELADDIRVRSSLGEEVGVGEFGPDLIEQTRVVGVAPDDWLYLRCDDVEA